MPVAVVQPMNVSQPVPHQIINEKSARGIPKKFLYAMAVCVAFALIVGAVLTVTGMVQSASCTSEFELYYEDDLITECQNKWANITAVGWIMALAGGVLSCTLCCLCSCERKATYTQSFRRV